MPARTYRDIDSLEAFARHYRLKITADGCDDPIIQGTNGHLWWEPILGLCWTVEGPVTSYRKIRNLLKTAMTLWSGDGGYDMEARGIGPVHYRKVITLAGVRRKRTRSVKARP